MIKMGFDMVLNIFVEHPGAAVVCLLMGGGILFGIIGGLTGIVFFTEKWILLIGLGFVAFIILVFVELARG